MKKRRIAVVIGSDSDLPQCLMGLNHLKTMMLNRQVDVVGVNTMSIHRNLMAVLNFLKLKSGLRTIDAIVAGAGWAAHLPGMLDAFLGYELHNQQISIIGVGFEDPENERHTRAAELSISEVPGTRVIYRDETGHFMGPYGFLRACKYAVAGMLPEMKEMKPRPTQMRSLDMAIEIAQAAAIKASPVLVK